eukprot:SAG31_NODE_4443_length_3226_cov_2.036776_3_plen_84_part_00
MYVRTSGSTDYRYEYKLRYVPPPPLPPPELTWINSRSSQSTAAVGAGAESPPTRRGPVPGPALTMESATLRTFYPETYKLLQV